MASNAGLQLWTNNAISLLQDDISPTDTVIYVQPGLGDLFPQPINSGEYFLVTLEDVNQPVAREIIKVTARVGDTFTSCERGQEQSLGGAAPQAWTAGATLIDHRITAGTIFQSVALGAIGSSAAGTITTWSVNVDGTYSANFAHNLNSENIIVSCYDSSTSSIIIPNSISIVDNNTISITVADEISLNVVVIQAAASTAINPTIKSQAFLPSDFLVPNTTDWAINSPATITSDSVNSSIEVISFSSSLEEGIGTILHVPFNATNISIKYRGRAATAQSSAEEFQWNLYTRALPNGTTFSSWSTQSLLSVSIPVNAYFQLYTFASSLSSLGLTPGSAYQIELTRNVSVTNNLAAPFLISDMQIEFS
jgi:hypothetical protein